MWKFLAKIMPCCILGSIAAAAKSLQSYSTLCDPIDSSSPGFPVLGILQARTLEWVAISFSNRIYRDNININICNIRSDQSLSRVWLFATPWIAARQASLSVTNFRSSLRLTSIESVMPSSHLILCHPLLLLPSIPPSIRIFSNE